MSTSAGVPQSPLDAGHAEPAVPPKHFKWKRLVIGAAILAVLVLGVMFAIPKAVTALNTISTDDAYVNGHVTFVAPRVAGQVKRDRVLPSGQVKREGVLVDDNYRVKTGDVLVQLDPEPYEVQVNIKQAALTAAEADLKATEADVRGTLAQLRSQRWKLQNAIEQVDNQVAILKARVAALRSKEETLKRANADLARAKEAYEKGAAGKQDYDAAVEAAGVAAALAKQAAQEVAEVRVSLGQPAVPKNGDLTSVPDDLNQTFSTVRQTLADLIRITAQLGLQLTKSEATPTQVINDFRSQDKDKDVDRIFDTLVPKAPAMIQAQAKVAQAKRDLDQALLNLRYCRVEAEVDGVVTRRNVNPGNNVQAGQQIMAIRSLTEIWIDANFKETQLAELRIGQRVDVFADTYGSSRAFRGRITGFTYGTGSTLALLPAQNATGNFVKVVQRLPVRIEFEDYKPDEDTLFAGLSVTPYVYYKEPVPDSIPDGGRRLQQFAREGPSAGAGAKR